MQGRIKKEDLDDRLLMATCAILHSHENRALCPKEVAEVMFERQWLHNAGTTPFAHVSTCIRSHLRRANGDGNSASYPALLLPFDLTGALTPPEVRAVGLRADERPAVKRGTLWYLNEAVLGKGVGAEDPFIRCRREAGLEPSEFNGVYVRTRQVSAAAHPPAVATVSLAASYPPPTAPSAMEEDDDDSGMGRGKRKRRASSAAMAATEPSAPVAIPALSTSAASAAHNWSTSTVHRRSQSFGSGSQSLPTKSAVPRLRLRLASLEEVDSGIDESDGQTSDAQRRRKNKKKARRAASEGTSRGGSVISTGSDEEHDLSATLSRPPAFSSAASSALLAQSLLAASIPSPSIVPSNSRSSSSVVSPDSLHFASGPFNHRHSHLSMSAPNLFSAFSSAPSPEFMDIDENNDVPSKAPQDADNSDSADEDDFHEAMLRGDDFDFEWSSESYENLPAGGPSSSYQKPNLKGKDREMSIELGDANAFDDMDALSTPATTPRSPQPVDEDLLIKVSKKMGMEETLCGAFADDTDRSITSQDDDRQTPGKAGASDATVGFPWRGLLIVVSGNADRTALALSLASLVKEESDSEHSRSCQIDSEDPPIAVPLPSPLALELSPLLPLSAAFSADYDFVGHEDDDRSHYNLDPYDRDMAESADDEDEEEDDIVTVKIEDDDTIGLDAALAAPSREPTIFPLDSFNRRIMLGERHLASSRSSSSASSDSDGFDPHMIVSDSLLASGFTIPQVAPSPPDTSDWGVHLDLDDLELDIGSGTDLLGPETIGLEELDLAWGGPAEQLEDETDCAWRVRTATGRARARGLVVGPTFLTGSPGDAFATAPLQHTSDGRMRTKSITPSPTINGPSPSSSHFAPALDPQSRSDEQQSATDDVVVYPKTPLTPTVTARIIRGGIAVYATSVVDSEDNTTYSLFRRLDTDYINGSVLLQVTFTSVAEREAILLAIPETFKVNIGEPGIGGTWVPLSHARVLVTRFPALSHLVTFLDDELGSRFPEPIPSMRVGLRSALATSSSSVLGYPSFPAAFIVASDRFTERSKVSPPSASTQRIEKAVDEVASTPLRKSGRPHRKYK
ncbi:hypothetical protein P7C70_g492, partial [Phenoliferia sp. Uapishka_3]